MANFNTWKDVFKIEWNPNESKESFAHRVANRLKRQPSNKHWLLIDKTSDTVVGRYDSLVYAKNRAKFKFKRQMRLLDRMLLGNDESRVVGPR